MSEAAVKLVDAIDNHLIRQFSSNIEVEAVGSNCHMAGTCPQRHFLEGWEAPFGSAVMNDAIEPEIRYKEVFGIRGP